MGSDLVHSTIQRAMPWVAELLDRTGAIARQHFDSLRGGSPLTVELKGDMTPVTAADKEIETHLRAAIAATFPDHGILGEEFGGENTDARVMWVLDPIDGTKAFATGKPLFGTLIGLAIDGVPVAGWMDCPATRERWVGAVGQRTLHNGQPVGVRPPRDLASAVLYCTDAQMFAAADAGPRWAEGFSRLCDAVQWACWNCDCYAYGMLACGTIDLVVERDLKPHDWCALAPIIEGAGGVIHDLTGRPLRLAHPAGGATAHSAGDVVAATCPELAARVVQEMGSP